MNLIKKPDEISQKNIIVLDSCTASNSRIYDCMIHLLLSISSSDMARLLEASDKVENKTNRL